MSREINTHQVAFLVQSFDGAPSFGMRNGRCGYLYGVESSKERGDSLVLLALIKLTISYQGIEEHLVLVIDSKEVLAGYSETVEATTQRQAFECLSVDIAEAKSKISL